MMTRQIVSDNVVAFCISSRELGERGLDVKISDQAARLMVNEELEKNGVTPWDEMEVELFIMETGLLLFARPSSGEKHTFVFKDIESVVGAALCMSNGFCTTLTYQSNRYLLTIGCPKDKLPLEISEFGDYVNLTERELTHIEEHGEVLIRNNAVEFLKEKFVKSK